MNAKSIIKSVAICSFAVIAILAVGTELAHAGGNDFQNTVQRVGTQASALPKFINFICYVLGIGLVGKGVLVGKKYSENPANTTLLQVLGPLGVGGMLLVLPTVADLAINSTIGTSGGSATFKNTFQQTY